MRSYFLFYAKRTHYTKLIFNASKLPHRHYKDIALRLPLSGQEQSKVNPDDKCDYRKEATIGIVETKSPTVQAWWPGTSRKCQKTGEPQAPLGSKKVEAHFGVAKRQLGQKVRTSIQENLSSLGLVYPLPQKDKACVVYALHC